MLTTRRFGFVCLALLLACSLSLSGPARAAGRVALLVGNAAYAEAPLVNPPNDVKALAKVLRELGFEVNTLTNTNQKALQKGIREFGENARRAEVALFYYSGHGLQSRGENYLVPIGAQINYESDIPDETVSANSLLHRLEEAQPKAAVVIMDACRDNPVAGRSKSLSKGLIRMEAPSGTLVAYATAPGTTASDEGFYARALAKYLKVPGLDIKEVFDQVGAEVDRLSNGKQRPRKDDGLYAKVYLVSPPTPPGSMSAPPIAAEPSAAALELTYWQSAQQTDNVEGYDAYLEQYPSGRYAKLARAAQAKLKTASAVRLSDGGERPQLNLAERRTGDTIKDCLDCPEMVVIPAGSFLMGSNDGNSDEKPVHRVKVNAFALAKTEVTQGQWRAVMGSNPSEFSSCGDDCPVDMVSWNDAQDYVRKLSAKTGQQYRLPSEAEWEYAARAGTVTKYWWGDQASHEYMNYGTDECCSGLASGRDRWENTAPVGQFPANAFGLYDMNGNVGEWVEDCWNGDYSGAPSEGNAWTSGECGKRVLRGGSWFNYPRQSRAAKRFWLDTTLRGITFGFRPARVVSP